MQDNKLLLEYITKGTVCELNELKQLYKGEHQLELKPLLQQLVTDGRLNHRQVREKEEVFELYWIPLKNLGPATPTPATPTSRLSSFKRRPLYKRCAGASTPFVSPLLSNKRRCVAGGGGREGGSQPIPKELTYALGDTERGSEDGERTRLLKELREQEERIRRLKLVKLYKSKHDLDELRALIDKWREASQDAALQLLELSTHPDKSLKGLLDSLNIDYSTIHYSQENDDFY